MKKVCIYFSLLLFSFLLKAQEIRLDSRQGSMPFIRDTTQFQGTCYAWAFGDYLDTVLKGKNPFYSQVSKIALAIDNNVFYRSRYDKKTFFFGHLKELYSYPFPLSGGSMENNLKIILQEGIYPYHLLEGRLHLILDHTYFEYTKYEEKLYHLFDEIRISYIRNDPQRILYLLWAFPLTLEKIENALQAPSFLVFLKSIFLDPQYYTKLHFEDVGLKGRLVKKSKMLWHSQDILEGLEDSKKSPIIINFCFSVLLTGKNPELTPNTPCYPHASLLVGKRLVKEGSNPPYWEVLLKDSNPIEYSLHEDFIKESKYKLWINIDTLLSAAFTYYKRIVTL